MHWLQLHITAGKGKGGQDLSYISSEAGHSRVKTLDCVLACAGEANGALNKTDPSSTTPRYQKAQHLACELQATGQATSQGVMMSCVTWRARLALADAASVACCCAFTDAACFDTAACIGTNSC